MRGTMEFEGSERDCVSPTAASVTHHVALSKAHHLSRAPFACVSAAPCVLIRCSAAGRCASCAKCNRVRSRPLTSGGTECATLRNDGHRRDRRACAFSPSAVH